LANLAVDGDLWDAQPGHEARSTTSQICSIGLVSVGAILVQ